MKQTLPEPQNNGIFNNVDSHLLRTRYAEWQCCLNLLKCCDLPPPMASIMSRVMRMGGWSGSQWGSRPNWKQG